MVDPVPLFGRKFVFAFIRTIPQEEGQLGEAPFVSRLVPQVVTIRFCIFSFVERNAAQEAFCALCLWRKKGNVGNIQAYLTKNHLYVVYFKDGFCSKCSIIAQANVEVTSGWSRTLYCAEALKIRPPPKWRVFRVFRPFVEVYGKGCSRPLFSR
jgi:hypothetical protein